MEQKSDEEKEIQQDFGYDYQKYGEQQAFMAAPFSEYNASFKDIDDQTYIDKSTPWIEVKVSKVGSEFENANVLGMDILDYMYLSIIFDVRKKQVSIVDTEIKIEENSEDN
ncbi:hypothetical protein CAEBREN_17673 [Caenorhabditis brenneri]|uniref:Uncharacterized protein n=1 Tax=Caenorhabditis brenneri TaxID=135651 RepID=G0NVZ3_CAEBE|nr:hypothetical protein CAEBREN_17673 [Caenorhabditis brenneri]